MIPFLGLSLELPETLFPGTEINSTESKTAQSQNVE